MKNEIHDDMGCDRFVIEMKQNGIRRNLDAVNQMVLFIDKIEKRQDQMIRMRWLKILGWLEASE